MKAKFRFLIIVLLLAVLTACATTQKPVLQQPAMSTQPPQPLDIKASDLAPGTGWTKEEIMKMAGSAGASNFYGATSRTGGGSGSLDSVDGTNLAEGDVCHTVEDGNFFVYRLNATSGAAESDPDIISPDTNAGNKRWILVFQGNPYIVEIAQLIPSSGNVIFGNGTSWVSASGDTARTYLGLGTGNSPTWTGATLSGLTPTRLLASDGSKALSSTALYSWLTGTTSQITVSDDGDGTVTLSGPQDLATTSSPEFVGQTLSGLTPSKPVFTDGSKAFTSSGTVPIDQGGTGQTTASAAFGALKQAATDSATGVVELATNAETQTGTDTGRAVTPDGVTAAVREQSWAQDDSLYIAADEIRARDSGGLKLYDDSGAAGIFVQDGGNVGIGTVAPQARMHVYGTSNFPNTPTDPPIAKFVSSSSQVPVLMTSGAGDAYFKGDSGGNLALGAEGFIACETGGFGAAREKMRITSAGNVGIGTTNPQEAAHIVGNIRNSALAGTGNRAVYSTADGNLTNSSSDRSLKTNIETLDYGMAETMDMLPVRFNWKDTSKRGAQDEIGFIAQDMEEIIPEVVGMNADGTKTVDYAKITAVLCKTIQEQQAQIEALTARVETLEGGN